MVEACKMKFKCNEPHSAGVLPAVSYNPGSGSCEPEKVAKCCSPTCCEEYNIIEVLLQTCKLNMSALFNMLTCNEFTHAFINAYIQME